MSDGRELAGQAPGAQARDRWAYASQYDDIDAQAAHFRGFGQHYEQLSAGPFRGRFESYQFGRQLTVHLECANRELMQSASTPHDRFGFSLVAPGSPPCVLNGQPVGAGDLILYPAGTTVEGTTPEGMRIFCIDMEAELLVDDGPGTREIRVVRDADRTDDLKDLIVAGIEAFTHLGAPTDFGAAASAYCGSLSELVWRLASTEHSDAPRTRRRGRRQAFAVYHRARELLARAPADGASIVGICRAVGVSRRSLECAFRTVIGMSPAHYVRTLQLNRVRRDLLSAEHADSSIGVIAARHGVWHWSRFSQSYRTMFGELPSQTRRRLRAGTLD